MTHDHWITGDILSARAAPHETGGTTHQDIVRSWILAAAIVGVSGIVLFGPAALDVLAVSIFSAVAADLVLAVTTRRPVIGGLSHAVLTGLLLGLTLPATVPLYVATFGSVVAILLGKGLFGGLGHYIWQPALVGRVIVQLVFVHHLSLGGVLSQSPVLAPGHLLIGDITRRQTIDQSVSQGWQAVQIAPTVDAVLMRRPVQTLRLFAEGKIEQSGQSRYAPLLRDALPPWRDTVFGTVPGGIGETCTLALVVGGLYLIYRGFLRWQLPVVILTSAALAAAVLPVETAEGGYDWFPVLQVENGRAVGIAYVLFHLTTGELMLGAFLLAGDMIATPMRARGQMIFAALVGVLTVFMRLYGLLAGECYWSILIMNTFTVPIDRRMKRPVLGLSRA